MVSWSGRRLALLISATVVCAFGAVALHRADAAEAPQIAASLPKSLAAGHLAAAPFAAGPVALDMAAAPVLAAPSGAAQQPPPADPNRPLTRGDLLIPNHSFESGRTGWRISCSAATTVTAKEHAAGNQAAALRSRPNCPSPTLTSAPLAATPQERYTAFVSVRSQSGIARANLVFLDARRAVIRRAASTHTGRSAWTVLRPAGIAPAKTRYVAVEIAARTSSAGTVYADDVRISRAFTDLGPQLFDAFVHAVTIGKDGSGRDAAYAITDGGGPVPAHLVVIDAASGTVSRSFRLNTGSPSGSWAATTATDGTIYVASFQPGMLWAYRPGAAAPTKVATISRNQIPFAIAPGTNGSVYVGGYPDAVVYKYMPGRGLVTFADVKKLTGQDYVRSLAVDLTTRTVYVGVGAKAGLLACNEQGAKCTNITPAQFRGQEFVYQIAAARGKALVYLAPSSALVVMDVAKQPDGSFRSSVRSTIPDVSYPGASADFDGKAYYRDVHGTLHAYDLTSGISTPVAGSYPGPRGWGQVDAADEVAGPGGTILSAGSVAGGVQIASYRPATGVVTRKIVTGLPGAPVRIQSLGLGPDRNVYASGYLTGGLASYTPMRSDLSTSFQGFGQAEGMAAMGNALYLGVYPGAVIQRYQPDQPFAAGSNPARLCDLVAHGQDRPYALTAGGGKLYIGTMAAYGQVSGALNVYDPATGRCTTKGDLVRQQSIVSLAYQGGIVYGGSLVWGGFGARPTQAHARLLIYDPRTEKARTVPLPVTSASVEGLTIGPNGNIWMMAQDWLLIYSPPLGRFVYKAKPFGDLGYPKPPLNAVNRISAYDAFLTTGADGGIYGTLHGRHFFRLDPRTAQATALYTGSVGGLTADSYGNIYFVANGDHLVRYVP